METNPNAIFATNLSIVFCAATYDGLLHWNETIAGQTVEQSCPSLYGWSSKKLVYKTCGINGSWENALTPTNYSGCADINEYQTLFKLSLATTISYVTSFVVIMSSIVAFYARFFQDCRNMIHTACLGVFCFNALSWIGWHYSIVQNVNMLQENSGWCRFGTLANTYFNVSTYMWTLSEGLILHTSLPKVLKDPASKILICTFLSNVFPLFLVIASWLCRLYLGDTERCMIESSLADYIYKGPIVLSILILVYYMMKILVKTASNSIIRRKKNNYRCIVFLWLKFSLALCKIPEIYYLFALLQPFTSTWGLLEAYAVSMVTGGQGMFAAMAVCFGHKKLRRIMYRVICRDHNLELNIMNDANKQFLGSSTEHLIGPTEREVEEGCDEPAASSLRDRSGAAERTSCIDCEAAESMPFIDCEAAEREA